jgi:hypothetical protein
MFLNFDILSYYTVSFQKLPQKMVNRQKITAIFFIIMLYLASGVCVFLLWKECYKLKKYVLGQCQVNSVRVRRKKKKFRGVWNVTVMDNERRSYTLTEDNLSTIDEVQKYRVLVLPVISWHQ